MVVMRSLAGFVGAVALSTQLWSSFSLAQKPADLCSDYNTAGTGKGNFSIYQTHGLCGDFCSGKAAYAIMNYQECWCSDYTPADDTVVDDDKCDTKCPAFSEWCGGPGVYGYLQVGTPKGTKGANDGDDEDDEPTGVATVTATDGGVRTITLTPTSANTNADAAGAMEKVDKKGPGGGAIAGIVIGVLLGLLAVVALGWFIMKRRRRAQEEEDNGAFEPRSSNSTAFTGLGPDMKEANGLNGAAGTAGKRSSKLLPADPRMDPFHGGIYTRTKSRESVNTLHDEHDYSRRVHQPPRVLRAVNPDPLDE